jgi:polar amino acid transport system substrate-binding protein
MTAAVAVFAWSAQVPASAETLRVGMECTYAPFNFKNADGELDGYDVDVAKGVAGLIGADLEFVCQKWDGMIPALLANKFDLIIASMSITEKRLEKMDFSDTYRISVGRLVGKKDSGWELFDDAGKPIPANFAGLKVGLERATTYSDWFENEERADRYDHDQPHEGPPPVSQQRGRRGFRVRQPANRRAQVLRHRCRHWPSQGQR